MSFSEPLYAIIKLVDVCVSQGVVFSQFIQHELDVVRTESLPLVHGVPVPLRSQVVDGQEGGSLRVVLGVVELVEVQPDARVPLVD